MKYYKPFSIVVLLILVGVNIKIRIPASPQIDPSLVPYVETFKKLCSLYKADCSKTDDFKIELVSMETLNKFYRIFGENGSVIGQCWRKSNEIEINVAYFHQSIPSEIEQLVIHELGHCVLGLEHTETMDIMNPYTLPYKTYLLHYNELINRFFSCKDFCPMIEFNQYQSYWRTL